MSSELKDVKDVKEIKGKELLPAYQTQPDDDIPFRSNFTRTDNYRSLAWNVAPDASQPLTSSFGNQFSYRGFAVSPQQLFGSKPSTTDWTYTMQKGQARKPMNEVWNGSTAQKHAMNEAKHEVGSGLPTVNSQPDVPPIPHWVDPNFSFDTVSRDILYDISRLLLEQPVDYEHVDGKFKIRGVVYEENYNVEFTIRQYRPQDHRLYTIEVQRKKSPVVPFALFYKGLKEKLGDLVFVANKASKKSDTRRPFELFDDLGEFTADPVTAATLAPFQTMIQSQHQEVQKEGLRALVGLAAASEANVKAMIDCHRFSATRMTDNDDKFDWIAPLVKFLDSIDLEMVRLATVMLRHLFQYRHEEFHKAAATQCIPKLFKLLDEKSSLLFKEIHRQAATALAGLCRTQSKAVLAAKGAETILAKHQYLQDFTLRTQVGQILSCAQLHEQ